MAHETNTTEIPHVGTYAGHTGHRPWRPLWWKGYRPRVRPLCGSPKVPSGAFSRGHLFVLILVVTADASLAILRQSMTITFATIVSRGYYSLREFRSGRGRSCLSAIYGAASVLLNGAALRPSSASPMHGV